MTKILGAAGEGRLQLDYRDLLDVFPAAVYATDANGRVIFFNQAAEELAGRTPDLGRDQWCVSWRLYTPSGEALALDECPMALALKEGRAVRGVEIIAERPNGERVPVMPFPTPICDATGSIVAAVNMLVDISVLKAAENAAARRAEEQAALFHFTDRLYRAETIEDVYAASLDAIAAALGCSRSSILLFDAEGRLDFVAWRGLSDAYRNAVSGHTPWKMDERDARPIVVPDVRMDGDLAPLLDVLQAEGIGALAFVPVTVRGGVVGKFMLYRPAPHEFDVHEIDLALTIARQLGFAIERARADEYRARVQAELQRGKERLDLLFMRSGIGMVLTGQDGAIVSANPASPRSPGARPAPSSGARVWSSRTPTMWRHTGRRSPRSQTPDRPPCSSSAICCRTIRPYGCASRSRP
jgi:PAS domain S-box-containing protein